MARIRKLHIRFYRQQKLLWCGPGALKIMLKCYQSRQIHQKTLARLAGTKRDGTSAQGMVRAARAMGQDVATKKNASFKDLKECLDAHLPAIVSYVEPVDEEGHYAVVVGLSDKHIWLHDPYHGPRYKLKRSDFYPRWRYHQRWMMWPVWSEVRKQ